MPRAAYRQPLIAFFIAVAAALALAGRVVLHTGPSPRTWLDGVRLALPVLLAVGAGITFLGRMNLRRGRSAFTFLASPTLRAALVLAWSVAATYVDLASGGGAWIFVFGVISSSLLAWKDRRFVFAAIPPSAIALSIGVLLLRNPFDIDATTTIVAATVMGMVVTATIRGTVTPGEERLQYLERENKELWDLSFHDGLTGLFNRRYAQETGQKLFNRAIRYHEQFHALMIDIDHFKRVNDTLGHAAGDEVLKEIATILQDCVRASDFVVRYGGEEFVVYLVQADSELVQNIANRIRDEVASHGFEMVPWQVTISIGVASIQNNDRLENLLDRADKYLYISKRSGRNRVSGF
ncbi:MAG: diguanylate cyclase [Rectinemataceae bacterium]